MCQILPLQVTLRMCGFVAATCWTNQDRLVERVFIYEFALSVTFGNEYESQPFNQCFGVEVLLVASSYVHRFEIHLFLVAVFSKSGHCASHAHWNVLQHLQNDSMVTLRVYGS